MVVIGGLLKYFGLIEQIMNIAVIGYATIFFGILLFVSDKNKEEKKLTLSISNKEAFIIGLYQILALIPGTSRSGITISGARFLKFNRVDAAKFSFLLSIPTLSAAFILSSYETYLKCINQLKICLHFFLVLYFQF